MKDTLGQYRNYIILGAIFLVCVLTAVHASHDDDPALLSFSIDSAKQVLAAILTVTTIGSAMQRKTDSPSEGQK